MINIGFDFDIELGADWLQEWRDYFPPQLLCMAALSIVARNEEMSIEYSNWSPSLVQLFSRHAPQIK